MDVISKLIQRNRIKVMLGIMTASLLLTRVFADVVGDIDATYSRGATSNAGNGDAKPIDAPKSSSDATTPTRSGVVSSSLPPAPSVVPRIEQPSKRDDVLIDASPLDETKAILVQESIVRFAEEVDVPSTESGLLAELKVAPGTPVSWGDLIARLDDRSLRIRSHAAALKLQSARQMASDDLELQYAETALQEAQAELDASRSIYNDAAGAVPIATLRRLRLGVERAQLEVARARKAAELAKTEVDLRTADVSMLDDTMKRLVINSPLTGVVLQVYRQRGEWVSAGEPVARVARIDRLEIHGLLSSDQLSPEACRDQPVTVRWSDPAKQGECVLRGRVTSIQPQRLPGGRYRFQAIVANDKADNGLDWQLNPGTEVRMHVYPSRVTR